ncbi:hypothetical protein L1887_50317 [Cichorium endivia]|nr:hypothetical protein L1887_50317 [Cichorium endivia]
MCHHCKSHILSPVPPYLLSLSLTLALFHSRTQHTTSQGLAVDNGLPGHHVLEELLVLGLGDVEGRDGVRVGVGGHLEDRLGVLAAANQDTGDEVVVVLAKHTEGAHGVLARGLETRKEAADEVVGLEDRLELVVVLVVELDDRVSLGVKVLKEPGQRLLARVLVRVGALPLVQVERRLGQVVQRVLGLGRRLGLVVLVVLGRGRSLGLLGLGSGGSLGLLLLLGRNKLDVVLGELELLVDGEHLGLVGDGVEVAHRVGVLGAEVDAAEAGEDHADRGGEVEVGEGDAVADDEGLLLELGLDVGEGTVEVGPDTLLSGLVVGDDVEAEEHELDAVVQDLVLGERDPLVDKGGRLGVGAEQLGVVRKAGDCERVEKSKESVSVHTLCQRNGRAWLCAVCSVFVVVDNVCGALQCNAVQRGATWCRVRALC